MISIKAFNNRARGYLFHYGHFITDCLIPDISNSLFEYDVIYRISSLDQTLGCFYKIYEDVMKVSNVELPEPEYKKLNAVKTINVHGCDGKYTRATIKKTRGYILNRYNVSADNSYPEVVLIERGERKELLCDAQLRQQIREQDQRGVTNGKERRRIEDIDDLKDFLSDITTSYECIVLEDLCFEKQVKYFYNAKAVIGVHGAGLSNILFCNKDTTILEIEPIVCKWYEDIAGCNELNHLACDNDIEKIKHEMLTNIDI